MNKILKISLAACALFSGYLLVASAQTATTTGNSSTAITFPVAELGNCGSVVECRAYCNKSENFDSCTQFAAEHNLITPQQKEKNQKFSKALKGKTGPGGCNTADSCKSYCEDQSHSAECLAFAEQNELGDAAKLNNAKKIQSALKEGTGPGGCSSLQECKTFCSKAENAKTCLEFAQANGLVEKEDGNKIQKFNELVKAGQTPGNCQTKDACETYCDDSAHKQECADFAAKLGIINEDQAKKIKNLTSGPGNCQSKEACQAYCNLEEHHDECLNFAQQNGLIKSEDAKNIKDVTGKLKDFVNNSPDSLKACIKQALGDDAYGQIISGQYTPTPDASKKISVCLQNNPPAQKPGERMGDDLKRCVMQKIGNASGTVDTQSPAVQNAMKDCVEQMKENKPNASSTSGSDPKECMEKKLGENKFEQLKKGMLSKDDPAVVQAMKDCGVPGMPNQMPDKNGSSTQGQGMVPMPKVKAEIYEQCREKVVGSGGAVTQENNMKIMECVKKAIGQSTPNSQGEMPMYKQEK